MICSTRVTRPFAPLAACAAFLLVLMSGEAGAEATVSNVRAIQRPGTKLIDIDYNLTDASDPVTVRVRISSSDGDTFEVPTTSLSGAFGAGMTTGTNKRITWNAGVDWNGHVSPEMRFEVDPNPGEGELSNRTYVDSERPIDRPPVLKDSTQSGRRYISFETEEQTLERPDSGSVPVYLQVKVPEFSAKNGGWGKRQVGLGCFYGMEINASGTFPDAKIYYKVGGKIPGPRTPGKEWKPTSFNSIINIPLTDETYYFKIVLGSGEVSGLFDRPLKVSASFKSARLCDSSGDPITMLNPAGDLWVLTHGKNDGEKSFRKMNRVVNAGAGPTQVASMDWASGASGEYFDLGAGRYFVNLGKNMAGLVKDQGFPGWKVHWVGHSWGANVGYETARSIGRVNRYVALDPAIEAPGYDDDRVDFGAVSRRSTGIKGGDSLRGLYGSESKTSTAHCAIRLFSTSHSDGDADARFFHFVPRDWFIRAMSLESDAYWPFYKSQILRSEESPDTPWKTGRRISGFDMEAYGKTSSEDSGQFLQTRFIAFKGPDGIMEARAKAVVLGSPTWSYSPRRD
ncbi:MAG: hypothetical protein V4819_16855 [Verrucomicrobiota bacterium]